MSEVPLYHTHSGVRLVSSGWAGEHHNPQLPWREAGPPNHHDDEVGEYHHPQPTRPASGVWRKRPWLSWPPGLWFMVYGLWFMVCGLWFRV